jgi:hypothetical protein
MTGGLNTTNTGDVLKLRRNEMTRKSLLALALTSVLTAPAMADTVNYIKFDVDGPGGAYGTGFTNSFDWLPGNALAKGSLPLNGGVACNNLGGNPCAPQVFELVYQTELSDVSGSSYPGGSIALPTGGDSSFEITLTASIFELLMAAPGGAAGTAEFMHLGGTFTIWYDGLDGGTGNANDVSSNETVGADYADGIPIMTGVLLPVGPVDATYVGLNLAIAPLDGYGGNGLPGIKTVQGIGSTAITFGVTGVNAAFFPQPPTIMSLNLTTTLSNPFLTINPSKQFFDGTVPNFGADGVNGQWQPGTPNEDFQFQADGSNSFVAQTAQVPEPASLALLGLGLAAMGFATRRRAA